MAYDHGWDWEKQRADGGLHQRGVRCGLRSLIIWCGSWLIRHGVGMNAGMDPRYGLG